LKEKLFCETYGDAIYLARMMANTFDDINYEQYDGCISAPALPEIRATKDIMADIKISPNPTNGLVKVDFPESMDGMYQVIDITGRILKTNYFYAINKIELDLSEHAGVNLVQITIKPGVSRVFKVFVVK
jgi:hypothetical protein